MPKKTTVAALALVNVTKEKATFSTKGTKVAPGSKYKEWKIKFGDGAEVGGNTVPNEVQVHDYPVLEPEPGITGDSYDVILEVKDNKGNEDQAVVDNVIILRNPINPPPTGLNITLVSPLSGDVGAAVTITGTAFGATQGSSTLTFDGVAATITFWSDTLIRCTVPNIGAGTAVIVLTVGVNSVNAQFDVTSSPIETFDFYVAPASMGGSNSNDGLAPTVGGGHGPKLTINAGIALLSAGKSLGVRGAPGGTTYAELVDEDICPSGTDWNNKVLVKNYNGEQVTIRPNSGGNVLAFAGIQKYIEFNGFFLDGTNITGNAVVVIYGISVSDNAHHIRIQNCRTLAATGLPTHCQHFLCTGQDGGGNPFAGVIGNNEFINNISSGGGTTDFDNCYYIQSPNNLIEGADISNMKGTGVQLYVTGSQTQIHDNLVRNCKIHDFNNGPGFRGQGCIVEGINNTFYNIFVYNVTQSAPGSGGIYIFTGNGNKVYNCTVRDCTTIYGIRVEASNTTLRNCISFNNGTNFLGSGPGTDNQFSLYGVNPFFVSSTDDAFQSSSPARNTGTAVAIVTTDRRGISRPQEGIYDIGSFEFVP